ncbi:alpha/beta fold hydrolase [Anaerotignum sp.]|uniref:alpha/beta fold hydrolase n=1 Tax=Anaerotignum sp. TaxID=2039241 RepID=UPI0027147588|nr:alpha/beta hydrolase [Anaerotignum sp.]
MIFKEIGDKKYPTIIFLHGGGLSDWSWKVIVDKFSDKYNVVTPIIDGHGEDGGEKFISIDDSASKLIDYIEKEKSGKVFAIGGLSIGAQILCEVLSQRPHITDYAIIESALVVPIKGITALTVPTYQLCYGLLKKRWFAKMQAQTLCVPDELFETYYRDSLNITKQSLINITLSNGNYLLKNAIANTTAKVLIIVGEKEIGVMKKSAKLLHTTLKESSLYIAPKLKHGELSLVYPNQYIEKLETLISNGHAHYA